MRVSYVAKNNRANTEEFRNVLSKQSLSVSDFFYELEIQDYINSHFLSTEVLLFSILLKCSYQNKQTNKQTKIHHHFFFLIITSEQLGADIAGLVIHLKSLLPAGFFNNLIGKVGTQL